MAIPLLKVSVVICASLCEVTLVRFANHGEYLSRVKTVSKILFLLLALPAFSLLAQTNHPASQPDAVLLTVEGRVQTARASGGAWTNARTNQVLRAGDQVRTGVRSRATLRLSDLSVLRVNELTSLEIRPPAPAGPPQSLNVKSGAIYFFNREKPSDVRFRTPLASGAIRGTEFNLAVADDGRTVLTLLDGLVDLGSPLGQVALASGEQGIVEAGQPPRKTAVIQALNIIQWALYYPGVLDPGEAGLSAEEQQALAASLAAYRSGDLLAAQDNYPANRQPASPAERTYRAATLLAVGQVEVSEALLQGAPSPLSDAMREMIAAVKNQQWTRTAAPATATEWMAESYYLQSRSRLAEARKAAQAAASKSTNFGFAWARLAELEFSFGRTDAARQALDHALQLSPRNAQAIALRGFLFAARNEFDSALAQFSQAIAVDGGLGNAWLGRGLCQIRQGHGEEGRQDLQVAATLEPQRAVLRSYLGKAWSETRDNSRAEKELKLAQKLDPNDPTSWLYSALLHQQDNRVNEAVRELEKSQALNDNRSVFRSRLLLDQDQGVRSANLAGIYRDAGMFDVSVREAARGVSYDYANYAAHLFLADSYFELLDSKRINIRYETAWQSELLVANLLAPAGAAHLSQSVSQEEYSRLFQQDGVGLVSETDYSSHGNWAQRASQHGAFGGTAYAIDVSYLWQRGYRPNNDLEQTILTGSFKQQLTEKDSILIRADRYDAGFGDLAQYYAQTNASRTLHLTERQEPNVLLGYHREWSPGNHTLLLLGRLEDDFTQANTAAVSFVQYRPSPGEPINRARRYDGWGLNYGSGLEAYTAELQQIWQKHPFSVIAGVRYQKGDLNNTARLAHDPVSSFTWSIFFPGFPPSPYDRSGQFDYTLERFNAYAYGLWEVCDALQLTGGVSYDWLNYPRNSEVPPLTQGQDERSQVSPKAGFILRPWQGSAFRGAYAQSLGGVYYDANVRLEPTQIAGFNQAFRSLIPESIAGLVPGTRFEAFGLAFDQKFGSGTYLGLGGELLKSRGSREVGAFEFDTTTTPPAWSSAREDLEFRERSLIVTLNQLLGDNFALGTKYKLTDARLQDGYPSIPATAARSPAGFLASQDVSGTLHQLNFYAIYQHRCGFFSEFDAIWHAQSNRGYAPDQRGDDFWQFNIFAGYRFARRHAELRLGVLNLAGRDYNLSPLTIYSELPRERTFVASFKFYF